MGAQPRLVMNIVCYPSKTLGIEALAKIMQGGADKVLEAGALIVGGHMWKITNQNMAYR